MQSAVSACCCSLHGPWELGCCNVMHADMRYVQQHAVQHVPSETDTWHNKSTLYNQPLCQSTGMSLPPAHGHRAATEQLVHDGLVCWQLVQHISSDKQQPRTMMSCCSPAQHKSGMHLATKAHTVHGSKQHKQKQTGGLPAGASRLREQQVLPKLALCTSRPQLRPTATCSLLWHWLHTVLHSSTQPQRHSLPGSPYGRAHSGSAATITRRHSGCHMPAHMPAATRAPPHTDLSATTGRRPQPTPAPGVHLVGKLRSPSLRCACCPSRVVHAVHHGIGQVLHLG